MALAIASEHMVVSILLTKLFLIKFSPVSII